MNISTGNRISNCCNNKLYYYDFYYRYHIELVKLLAYCTMGKNVYTEIKCHSLLPLDDIVAMISHPDCIPEVMVSYCHFVIL